jgi:hypothetical protein
LETAPSHCPLALSSFVLLLSLPAVPVCDVTEIYTYVLVSLWHTRRVVWSKEVIAFARIGEDAVVDSIPLTELKGVEKIDEVPVAGGSNHTLFLRKSRSIGLSLLSIPTFTFSSLHSRDLLG